MLAVLALAAELAHAAPVVFAACADGIFVGVAFVLISAALLAAGVAFQADAAAMKLPDQGSCGAYGPIDHTVFVSNCWSE